MRLRLTPLAARDVAEVRSWYDELSPALGERFEAALDSTFTRLSAYPSAYPVVRRKARRAPVDGAFAAYRVFYRVEADDLVVLAVIHGSRHPRSWRHRV
jgi:plasmid stabilization system protein ParE